MLFKNAELFDIAEIAPAMDGRGGYDLYRVPLAVTQDEEVRAKGLPARNGPGTEIRFVIESGTAKITMRTSSADPKATPRYAAYLTPYYGGLQSGWQTAQLPYGREATVIEIAEPKNLADLELLTAVNGYPYSPRVVRLLLPNGLSVLEDIEGDIRPPREDEVPAFKGLFYGSSITHGSLSLTAPFYYSANVARALRADIYNLGFAGSCRMEKAVADYVATRRDCDFFFSELGINVLGMDNAEFERRVRYYVNTCAKAHAGKYFVVTDVYYCSADLKGSRAAAEKREIVRRVCEESECANVVHIDGLELMGSSRFLSADVTHPNVDGVAEISRNLTAKLAEIMGITV